ncbi:MAG: hypothetical protein JRN52_01580 [Nitrososphaerota archaeon]|nr:hypothetical protein [Nitrososphaerota archaeon]
MSTHLALRFRERRSSAISEIIAALLMLLLVVSISASVYAYTSNGLGSFSDKMSNLFTNQGEAISQQFNVALATFNATSGLPPYALIEVANSQPLPTPSPFQQLVTINPSVYTTSERSDLGNIRFFSTLSGGTFSGPLDSWLESASSYPANSATSAQFWIALPNGIPASSNVNLYMVFEPTSTTFDGIVAGESPQLSATYGQYDNGAYVFPIYDNGTNLLALAQTGTGGTGPLLTSSAPSPLLHAITGSVNGGSASASTWTSNGETTSQLPSSYIAQMSVYLSGSSPLTDLMTNVQSISTGQFYVFRLDARSGSSDLIGNYPSGGSSTNILAQSSSGSSVDKWYQLTAVNSADQLSLYKSSAFSLSNFGTLEAGPVSGMGYSGGGIGVTTDGASSTEYWTMILVRAYPPNGVMPAATVKSFSLGAQAGVDLYVQNGGSLPITVAAVYVQNLTSSTLVGAFALNPMVTIQPGSFEKIPIFFIPVVGDSYQFTVVTTLGTSEISTFQA